MPYVRAAAATCARAGLPIMRPLPLLDPDDERGWAVADAFGFGPALWVAPVLEEGAREREVFLPRGKWIEAWSGERVRGRRGGARPGAAATIPVWVRDGSIVVTYPARTSPPALGTRPSRAPARGDALGPAADADARCGSPTGRASAGIRRAAGPPHRIARSRFRSGSVGGPGGGWHAHPPPRTSDCPHRGPRERSLTGTNRDRERLAPPCSCRRLREWCRSAGCVL